MSLAERLPGGPPFAALEWSGGSDDAVYGGGIIFGASSSPPQQEVARRMSRDQAQCWTMENYTNRDQCDPDEMQCTKGATGPMCGACQDGWFFAGMECHRCGPNAILESLILTLLTVMTGVVLWNIIKYDGIAMPERLIKLGFPTRARIPIVSFLMTIDPGAAKVVRRRPLVRRATQISTHILCPSAHNG